MGPKSDPFSSSFWTHFRAPFGPKSGLILEPVLAPFWSPFWARPGPAKPPKRYPCKLFCHPALPARPRTGTTFGTTFGSLLGPLLDHFWGHFWDNFWDNFGSFPGGSFDPENHSRAPFSGRVICQILLGDMGSRSDPGTRARIPAGAARRREGGWGVGGRNLSRGDYGAPPLLLHSNNPANNQVFCHPHRSSYTSSAVLPTCDSW